MVARIRGWIKARDKPNEETFELPILRRGVMPIFILQLLRASTVPTAPSNVGYRG